MSNPTTDPLTSLDLPNNTNSCWWRDRGLRKLLFWQGCIVVSQMTVGYDESVVGSLQAMKPWIDDRPDHCNSFRGGFVGAFLAAPLADRYGRRVAICTGAALTLIGTIIQTAAQSSGMFIGGRFVIGLGISFTCCAGPSLLNELAHPRMRGTIASMFNVLWYVGSIIAAWTTFGTGHMTSSSWCWRIPSLIQGVPSVFVIIAIPFIPESPRWLYSKGRGDEAKEILSRYHANGSLSDEFVDFEMTEISSSVDMEKLSASQSWAQLLKSNANRKRFGICIAVALLTLWNGQGVISYYFSPILTSIGITTTDSQTGINGGMQIWNFFCALAGAFLVDRLGRRTLWLTSFIGMILANVPLTISSAMYAEHGSKAAAYTVVVFLFLYNAAFNIACNPLLYCYATEILPFGIRARGLALQIAVSQAALTVNQYVNPIALDNIGFYYYIFYLGMLVLGTIIIYFFFPETKGYSLEELSHLFEDSAHIQIVGLERAEEYDLSKTGKEDIFPEKL
ncbi:Lactose permease [Lachnellula subtilissima]|uniref:Lactose permease n=1 Tax=Lachnellula subtilissima TaxID=602034 RepID=A0A8H8S3E0_9HELO|nr:Lactose permease [Lachnellula subtilissima]